MSMEQGRAKDDVVVPAIMQDLSQDPTLALHNSFIILTEELDIPVGEASLAEQEHIMAEQVDSMVKEHSLSNTSFGVQLVSNSTDGRNTQLIVSETQPTHSSNVAAITSVEILKENWGDLASDSDEQSLAHVSGCAMPQPITTYHTSLTVNKLPVLKPLVHTAVVCSSEAQRSVDILQKFWGDYTNEEPEFSLVCPSTARNKKQKKQTNRQVSPISTSSEHIQTHSKKGVIKINPKYRD